MEVHLSVVLALALFQLAALAAGFSLCYLGYRLFVSGIWGQTGDLESKFGNAKLVLRGAAPGTFFAVLGAAVIIFTVVQGFELNTDYQPLSQP